MNDKLVDLFNLILDEQRKSNFLVEQLIKQQALVAKQVFKQTELQSQIFSTKGEKKVDGLTQQEFYSFVKKKLEKLDKGFKV